MKIRPVGADRQTDMTKLTVAFRDFANPAKTVYSEILYRAAMEVGYY